MPVGALAHVHTHWHWQAPRSAATETALLAGRLKLPGLGAAPVPGWAGSAWSESAEIGP